MRASWVFLDLVVDVGAETSSLSGPLPADIHSDVQSGVDERRRFRLVWKALDRGRRWEVRRLAWLGRRASDPETAWFVKMFTEQFKRWSAVFVGAGLLWIALGTVTIAVMRDRGVDQPFTFGVALLQIITGLAYLGLLPMYRRAHRVNEPVAVPPGG